LPTISQADHPSFLPTNWRGEFRFSCGVCQGRDRVETCAKAEEGFKGAINERPAQTVPDRIPTDAAVRSAILSRDGGFVTWPINGHDLPLLISTLEFAKTAIIRSSFTS